VKYAGDKCDLCDYRPGVDTASEEAPSESAAKQNNMYGGSDTEWEKIPSSETEELREEEIEWEKIPEVPSSETEELREEEIEWGRES